MKGIFCIIFLFCFNTVGLFGGKGYEIKVKINNLYNVDLYLGYHFGSKLYVKDTLKLDGKSKGIFEGDEELKQGLYLIFLPNKTYFDIIIDENQKFSIECDTFDFVNNAKFSNSLINQAFYDYQKYLLIKQKELGDLREQLETNKTNEQAKIEIEEKIKVINNDVINERQRIIDENKGNFLSKLLLASMDIEIPDPPKDENGNISDSMFQYNYYRNHYFDHLDFSDDRLLRTPFIEGKLRHYFTVLPQIPDTLIPVMDTIIGWTKSNKEVFQFVLSYLFNKYLKSDIMGMDEVYVHLAENYYLSGEADWVDSSFKATLSERVRKTKPNLIGNKAPELKMQTYNGQWINLYDIKAEFTVLIFWSPDCGHCKIELPKLYETYKKYNHSFLEVFAVYTQYEKEEWVDFIEEKQLFWINVYDPFYITDFRDLYDIYSTPVVYLLDREKTIIAKRIAIEDIDNFLKKFVK